MSSQKGNCKRSRPQKHQNHTAWKSNATHTALTQNKIDLSGLCVKCLEVIEWKIKYNKYKPLTKPKKCTKCGAKNVKIAYHIMCAGCSLSMKSCPKCGTLCIHSNGEDAEDVLVELVS